MDGAAARPPAALDEWELSELPAQRARLQAALERLHRKDSEVRACASASSQSCAGAEARHADRDSRATAC
jgi:hypothetical protein